MYSMLLNICHQYFVGHKIKGRCSVYNGFLSQSSNIDNKVLYL